MAAQQRLVTVEMTPTARVQMAIWIESLDGERFATLALTDSVAFRGIGNRPGAQQMDSGYHWPYGRREGVLPIWAHRRYEATGLAWRRVVFAGIRREGAASRDWDEDYNNPDDFFCLSFHNTETLDAVSCASTFRSNKGRFITQEDVDAGAAEPWEDMPGVGRMRLLTLDSLYPPRGDVTPIADPNPECTSPACDHHHDHADLWSFREERLRVMPELDSITMATPRRSTPLTRTFELPEEWPDGTYVVFVEVNTEFDFNPAWRLVSPTLPAQTSYPAQLAPPMSSFPYPGWDGYANDGAYGSFWRGQPSVLYRVEVVIGPETEGEYSTTGPVGHGALHGETGDVLTMDGSQISDDPGAFPGSGADRLMMRPDGARLVVSTPVTDPCRGPMPPTSCGAECTPTSGCTAPLVCGPMATCVGRCTIELAPAAPSDFTASVVEDVHHRHEYADLTFVAPAFERGLASYDVRVSTSPIPDAATFDVARPAGAATLEDQGVEVPITAAGETVHVQIGHLEPTTHYYVAIRGYDECHAAGAIAVAEVETTEIHFTTVSPCFVATAAYGSPLDARIGVLRGFRDRWLMTNEPGRALVAAYYEVGPKAARWIGESEERRAFARTLLDPIVSILE